MLVGEFEGPKKTPYVMVVNKSIKGSTYFNIKFKEQGKIVTTSPYTGTDADFTGEQVWLAPGQGMLLHLER